MRALAGFIRMIGLLPPGGTLVQFFERTVQKRTPCAHLENYRIYQLRLAKVPFEPVGPNPG